MTEEEEEEKKQPLIFTPKDHITGPSKGLRFDIFFLADPDPEQPPPPPTPGPLVLLGTFDGGV